MNGMVSRLCEFSLLESNMNGMLSHLCEFSLLESTVIGMVSRLCEPPSLYGVATVSRIDKITGLFCRISSL